MTTLPGQNPIEASSQAIHESIKVYIRQKPSAETFDLKNVDYSGIKSYRTNGECSYYSSTTKKVTNFKYDGVHEPTISQSEVYDVIAKPVVESALNGYPGTILAYGPTNRLMYSYLRAS